MARMSDLVLELPADVWRRLELMAARMGQSVEDCARLGLVEFLDNWEDHLRTVAALEEDEDRPQLRGIAE